MKKSEIAQILEPILKVSNPFIMKLTKEDFKTILFNLKLEVPNEIKEPVIQFLEDLKELKKEKKLKKTKSAIIKQFAREHGLKIINHKITKCYSFECKGMPFINELGNVEFNSK